MERLSMNQIQALATTIVFSGDLRRVEPLLDLFEAEQITFAELLRAIGPPGATGERPAATQSRSRKSTTE